jgi:predicted ribosome-associated RNA-binding protein Tma20
MLLPKGIKIYLGLSNKKEQSIISNVELIYQYKINAWLFLNDINYTTNDKTTIEYIDNNYSTIMKQSKIIFLLFLLYKTDLSKQCREAARM